MAGARRGGGARGRRRAVGAGRREWRLTSSAFSGLGVLGGAAYPPVFPRPSPAPRKLRFLTLTGRQAGSGRAAVQPSPQGAEALLALFKSPAVFLPLNVFMFCATPSHPTNLFPVSGCGGDTSPGSRRTGFGLLGAEYVRILLTHPPGPAGPRFPDVAQRAVCLFRTSSRPPEPRRPSPQGCGSAPWFPACPDASTHLWGETLWSFFRCSITADSSDVWPL